MDTSDRSLLDRYIAERDEAAFRMLVNRHLRLVHAVARRVTANDELARDVAQNTFIRLATRAALIPRDVPLPGWLHHVARHMAINLVRSEERRRNRERQQATPDLQESPDPAWSELSPVIDSLVERLSPIDRSVLLLRFYDNQPHAAVARQLGLSEEAVKKRATRALEKLRTLLSRRGLATTASALATILPAHAAPACPPGLAASIAFAAKGELLLAPHPLNAVLFGSSSAQQASLAAAGLFFLASAGWAVRPAPEPASALAPPVSASPATTVDARPETATAVSLPHTPEGRLRRLEEILAIPGYLDRQREMAAFVNRLSAPQLEEISSSFKPGYGQGHLDEFETMIHAWARLDPETAADYMLKHGDNTRFGLGAITWAVKDPEAVFRWTFNGADS